MKYNVGDKVRIKSLDWYNKNKSKRGNISFPYEAEVVFTSEMSSFCGQIVTISQKGYTQDVGFYRIKEDRGSYMWADEMIEGLVEEETPLDKAGQITNFEYDGLVCTLPEGYIFKDENGIVINTTKIVLEKKRKEYPKTYEECCKILGFLNVDLCFNADYRSFDASKEQWKKLGLMNQFYQLLICRDAYWKIAGEEMGLGKPWEPNWKNSEMKYTISFEEDEYTPYRTFSVNCPFAFPTAEMRDAFKENFDPDIEICKELL